jgi:hypothetical protein
MHKTFTTYKGIFPCHVCKEDVLSLRLWHETLDCTWQCSKKHISKVNFTTKKKKKDYERKE